MQKGKIPSNAPTPADQLLTPLEEGATVKFPEVIKSNFDQDDAGNASAFAVLYLGRVVYVRGTAWHVFDTSNRKWIVDQKGDFVRRLAVKVAETRKAALPHGGDKKAWTFAYYTASRRGIENLIALAPTVPGMLEETQRFDANRDTVQSADGFILNLRTGSAREAMPSDRNSRALGVPFDRAALCPRWDAFLEQVLPDPEVRHFVQVFAGYCLTGRTSESVLVLLFGSGANGKSILLQTLLKVLGEYGASLSPEVLLPPDGKGPSPHDLAELQGVRLAVFSETNEGGRLNEAALKRSTSEDPIAARRLYQSPFSFLPTHKGMMGTNHVPRIRSTDEGTWRRLLLLRFPVTIPAEERDRDLAETLAGQGPGILNWALKGASEWYASGLPRPAAVLLETQNYREDQDVFGGWVAGQTQGPELLAPSGKLYDLYTAWAESEGLKAMAAPAFKRELKDRGFGQRRTAAGVQILGISLDASEVSNVGQPTFPPKDPHTPAYERLLGNVGKPTQEAADQEKQRGSTDLPEPAKLAAASGFGLW